MRDLEVDRIEAAAWISILTSSGPRDRIGDFGKADMVGDRAIAVEDKGSPGSSCGVEDFATRM